MPKWDVFISHASEDKQDVARPLANRLAAGGLRVWLDEAEMLLGDSLRAKIDDGLTHSQFGVVVLSPSFFAKQWPKAELDGLFALEADGQNVVLPIWHDVAVHDVRAYSAILAGRLAISTAVGIAEVAETVLKSVRRGGRGRATGRPIFAGKLTKKALFSLPVGCVLINNSVDTASLMPTLTEKLGPDVSRSGLWDKLRVLRVAGRKCYAFGDMANLREHLAARFASITEN